VSSDVFQTAASLSNWLAATRLSHSMQTSDWMIAALQTVHILSIAILFTSAVLVDLRLLGVFESDVPLRDVARRFLPVIWPVLLVLAASGALLIIAEPKRSLLNSTFYFKMTLLAAAILLTAALQRYFSGHPGLAEKPSPRLWALRLAAGASLVIWSGVIVAGRWIAYTAV
jgi:hypothetical protein